MKYQPSKRMLDKKATYYWEFRHGIYALVNAVTLKTAFGVNTRYDAVNLTKSLRSEGYRIEKMDSLGD